MTALKKIFLISLVALLIGFIVFIVALAAVGWDIKRLSNIEIKQEAYQESETNLINEIVIDYENADIKLSYGDEFSVSYPVSYTKGGKPASKVTVDDEGGRLNIKERAKWFLNIGFNFTSPKIYITIPRDRTVKLNFDTNNGDVSVFGADNIKFDDIKIDTDNGDIEIKTVSANNIFVSTNNGDVDFNSVYTSGEINIETDNGEVEFKSTVAARRIEIESDNGDISLDDALVDAQEIIISADNGDVELKVIGKQADYTVKVETDNGNANVKDSIGGIRLIDIETDNGDIELYFAE